MGRYPLAPHEVVALLGNRLLGMGEAHPPVEEEIVVFQVRLPRIVGAILVGGALAVSGAAYQNLFQNPLASPDILGVAAGASFGAALGLVLRLPWSAVQVLAFGGALLAVAFAFWIGHRLVHASRIGLLLAGSAIAAFFQALVAIVKYLADPMDTLPAITFWLMGGLAKVTPGDVTLASLPVSLSLAVLYAARWQVNVLATGEEQARVLGVHTSRVRLAVVATATLMTAASVSLSGTVAWVGLVVPHMARMVVGPAFPILLPSAFLLGGAYLLAVDTVARGVTGTEIPWGSSRPSSVCPSSWRSWSGPGGTTGGEPGHRGTGPQLSLRC